MHISFQQGLAILLALQFITCCDVTSAAQELLPDKREKEIDNTLRRVRKLHETRQGLTSLKEVLNDIDTDLIRDQQLACILEGESSDLCATLLENDLGFENWLAQDGDRRDSGTSHDLFNVMPSKRSGIYSDYFYPVEKRTSALERNILVRKRRVNWSPTCHFGGGNPGILCHTRNPNEMDRKITFLEENPTSPGKRSMGIPLTSFKTKAFGSNEEMNDIARKRRGLLILKRILDEMDSDIIVEQKRMCRFNLGGHCATESAAAVADQWHYLNSPLSPGRKRRDTSLFQKLMKGEIVTK